MLFVDGHWLIEVSDKYLTIPAGSGLVYRSTGMGQGLAYKLGWGKVLVLPTGKPLPAAAWDNLGRQIAADVYHVLPPEVVDST